RVSLVQVPARGRVARLDAPRDASVVHATSGRVWRVARPDLTAFVVRISPPGTPGGQIDCRQPYNPRLHGCQA
ncbi:MAG: hypothetical protein ACLQHS_01615, partial [Candidatus Limnocylindrales bacterium]